MKSKIFALVVLSFCLSAVAMANGDEERHHHRHFRMDCRFYDNHPTVGPRYCVSDATYTVDYGHHDYRIRDVQYGVRCDDQTIYNNQGVPFSTNQPSATTEDHIRPLTSNVPKTILRPQGSLVTAGTWEARLELENKALNEGSCDVMEVYHRHHHHDGDDGDDDDCGDDIR